MAEFPYLPNPAKIATIFPLIQSVGVPPKVTLTWLESIGIKSSNDRRIKGVFKTLGFTTANDEPTDIWKQYRNKENAPKVMANAIRNSYFQLFSIYPDAYRKDDEALRNFFSTHTNVTEKVVVMMVKTFKALCDLADFHGEIKTPSEEEKKSITGETAKYKDLPNGFTYTFNINIQLQLPESENSAVYDKLFEAMKKYKLLP